MLRLILMAMATYITSSHESNFKKKRKKIYYESYTKYSIVIIILQRSINNPIALVCSLFDVYLIEVNEFFNLPFLNCSKYAYLKWINIYSTSVFAMYSTYTINLKFLKYGCYTRRKIIHISTIGTNCSIIST